MRFVVLVFLVSCVGGADPIPPEIEADGTTSIRFPVGNARDIDVLFVIDNSPAMAQHAERLATNMRGFVDLIRAPITNGIPNQPRGLPNLHFGVVTTDVDCGAATDGVMRTQPGMRGNFVVDVVADTGLRERNYEGVIEDVVAKITNVGTTGCAQTQPLLAAKRALENPANAAFLRPNASLAVILISAHDAPDDSIEGYEAFFKGLGDPYRLLLGAIVGFDDPAGRIPTLVERFPRGATISMTSADWSPILGIAGRTPWTSYGLPCLDRPLDIQPELAGEQFECDAWYELPLTTVHIEPCSSSLAGPCWKLVDRREWCVNDSRLLELEQPLVDLPRNTWLTMECVSR